MSPHRDFDRRVRVALRRRRERLVRNRMLEVAMLGAVATILGGMLFGLRPSVGAVVGWALYLRSFFAGLIVFFLAFPFVAHHWMHGRKFHPASTAAGLTLLGACIWASEMLVDGGVLPLGLPGSGDRFNNLWRNLWFLLIWWSIAMAPQLVIKRLGRRQAS